MPPVSPIADAVGDPRGRLGGDALLLLLVARALVAQRQLVQDALGHRAPVGAREHALVLEELEIAPDRGRRDVELGREIGHAHRAVVRQSLEDRR